MLRWSLLALALLSVAGCSSGTLPDPNDPRDQVTTPEILRRNLASISDALVDRRLKREINNEQYRQLLAKAANELVSQIDLDKVDPGDAWQYGEILRAAQSWEEAKKMLTIAVENGEKTHNEDRRVNDTLRLAQVQAKLGDTEGAIATARKTMDAKPSDSAPIMMAVFYEIIPAVKDKTHQLELATLLSDAIKKHIATTVNTATIEGKEFIAARPYHLMNAYTELANMYDALNKAEEARAARDASEKYRAEYGRLMAEARAKAAEAAPPGSAGASRPPL